MATPRRPSRAGTPARKPARPSRRPAARKGTSPAARTGTSPASPKGAGPSRPRSSAKRPGPAGGKPARASGQGPRKARPKGAEAHRATKLVPRSRELVALEKLVLGALEDMKAVNVKLLDVRGLTDVADTMVVASGNSDRHVRAIAERVIEHAKAAGRRPMGTEGKQDAEWVLVDLQDVLVHVMLPRVREFYALEQLWEAPGAARRPEGAEAGA